MKRTNVSLRIYHWASKADKAMECMILHCPWDYYSAQKAYEYARIVLKKRWSAGEEKIIKHPYYAYLYARHVIQGRWKEAEKTIASKPDSGYLYAKFVMKERFEEVESKNHWQFRELYLYSKYVAKSRLKKLESKISKERFYYTEYLVKYAREFIKGRWEKYEQQIINSRHIASYASLLEGEEHEAFHNKVLAESLVDRHYYNYPRDYLKSLKTESSSAII